MLARSSVLEPSSVVHQETLEQAIDLAQLAYDRTWATSATVLLQQGESVVAVAEPLGTTTPRWCSPPTGT